MDLKLLRNARLLDVAAGELQEGREVLVEGLRIREVADRPIRASGAIEIDVGGRTLMPGLIDCHVHVFAVHLVQRLTEDMPLTLMTAMAMPRIKAMLDRGFTTVRDVGGGDFGIREAVARGWFQGPRLFVAGRPLSPTGGHGDHRRRTESRADTHPDANALTYSRRIVDGSDEIRRAVREELRRGVDLIKVMASGGVGSPNDEIDHRQFSAEELRTAVDEAEAWGSYVAAHAYTAKTVRHAVGAGIRTVEHANYIDEETARFVAEKGAFVVPTMVCYEETLLQGERYGLSAKVMEKLRYINEAGLRMLEHCQRAGVRMGLGTDLMGELEYAQSRELTIRAKVQTPAEVLRSATLVNALILRKEGELGVIAPGAQADMLVVDGDPLADLGLLQGEGRHLALIMKGGALYKNLLPVREIAPATTSHGRAAD